MSLVVSYRCDCGVGTQHTRPPTDDEVLAAAATLDGAEPLWSCEVHDAPGRTETVCWEGHMYEEQSACRMVEGRWFPLPDKETTDD